MSSAQVEVPGPQGVGSKKGIHFKPLIDGIEALTKQVVAKIDAIRSKSGEVGGDQEMSIADMFDLQMSMTKLNQFSEMSTSVVSAMNTAINTMAHNVIG